VYGLPPMGETPRLSEPFAAWGHLGCVDVSKAGPISRPQRVGWGCGEHGESGSYKLALGVSD
jgi:hypothetical protein